MADKLKDDEIVSELKRFGETVKVPIDKKKRPILIKKLNHFYAKENPPLKRGKARQKTFSRPVPVAEFSDDSQDESESGANIGRHSPKKNTSTNNSLTRVPLTRKTRNRTSNGATSSPLSDNVSRTLKNKRLSNLQQQIEVYPDEFSDNDTADESVYEVEEKSIGINTTLNYDDEDDIDESFETVNVSTRSTRKKYSDANISTISKANASSNDVRLKKGRTSVYSKEERDQFISKTILIIVAIFFVLLAMCYFYVRKDIFFLYEAALSETDLKEFTFTEEGDTLNFTEEQINKKALPMLKEIQSQLASLKGKYELGQIGEDKVRLTNNEVHKIISSKLKEDAEEWENIQKLCYVLILKYPKWEIMAFQADGMDARISSEVDSLESHYSDLPLLQRLLLAFYKVLYGLAVLAVCIFVGVLGIYYLRWQNKRREKEQQKVYDLVEKIIDMLKENFEIAESKGDSKNYPPYMAVQHIRDQLIPVSKRRQLRSLWDDAVKFIETNESRIRVETQVIQGEEFNVWRWLQAMPNGHKVWQGQAFGETSQTSVNSLPYGPTPCLKVRNMFDANQEKNVDDWHVDIEESVLEKCQDNHGILHIFVDRSSKEGCVYIKCSSCEKAYEAYQALHGWWFDGRLVTVKYLRLEHYHDRFPDSRNSRRPLQPSKSEMHSVSRPYHRSALEMT